MVMHTQNERRLLVGVASATNGNICAQGGGVAVYTNLALIENFIDVTMQQVADEE